MRGGRPRTIEELQLMETLCDRIMVVQEGSGLSKSRFAALVGLSPPHFTKIVKYQTMPSHLVIRKISSVFGVPTDYFYHGTSRILSTPLARQAREALARRGEPAV